jgi:hypothetical protein
VASVNTRPVATSTGWPVMKHFALANRLRSRGPDSLASFFASGLTRPQVVRMSFPIAHFVAALVTSKPGAPITVTGGPFGITTTVEVGRGTGSAQERAMSPSLTALLPPNETLRTPSGKVAVPAGGFTWATPGGMGRWGNSGVLRAVSSVVLAGSPLTRTTPVGSWTLPDCTRLMAMSRTTAKANPAGSPTSPM